MKVILKIKTFLILTMLLLSSILAKSQVGEYFVKAAFIEKFARFTEWKPNAIGKSFVIGVLGKSPFSGELEILAEKSQIKNKPVEIKYIKDYHDILNCQVLFICASEKDNLQEVINYLGNSNILIVGDTPGFSEKGVHFNFYLTRKGSMHFEINMKALVKAGLVADMQLLSIGRITK